MRAVVVCPRKDERVVSRIVIILLIISMVGCSTAPRAYYYRTDTVQNPYVINVDYEYKPTDIYTFKAGNELVIDDIDYMYAITAEAMTALRDKVYNLELDLESAVAQQNVYKTNLDECNEALAKVPDHVVVERKVVKETPWWNWVVIGVLGAAVIGAGVAGIYLGIQLR